jgi:hypothetical protein
MRIPCVGFRVAAVRPHDLHVDAVSTVADEFFDQVGLVAIAGAIGAARAAIKKALRIAGAADENVPAAVALEPRGMLGIDHELAGQRLGGQTRDERDGNESEDEAGTAWFHGLPAGDGFRSCCSRAAYAVRSSG